MNFSVLGTIGLLIWAKKTGEIETLSTYLDELRSKGKFRFSQALYERALREVNEF